MAVSFTPTTVSDPSGVQGTYPLVLAQGREGELADLQAYVSRSYYNQSGAAIPFGVFVEQDTSPASNDPFAVQISAGAGTIVGLSIVSNTFEGNTSDTYTRTPSPIAADGRVGYPTGYALNAVSKGAVYVYSAEAVDLGDAVRFFDSDYSGTLAGAFQGRFGKSAVAGVTHNVTAGARWLSKTTAAGLAILEIDIPTLTLSAD